MSEDAESGFDGEEGHVQGDAHEECTTEVVPLFHWVVVVAHKGEFGSGGPKEGLVSGLGLSMCWVLSSKFNDGTKRALL